MRYLLLQCAVVPLMAFVCPSPTHYPLGCTLCLSFSSRKSTQFVANQTCRSQGGALLTVDKELEWRVFQLYLESLNLNASKSWVGYRYDALDYITKSCAPNFGNRMLELYVCGTQLINFVTVLLLIERPCIQ